MVTGLRLRRLLHERTLWHLAAEADLSQGVLSQVERQERALSTEQAGRVASALGETLRTLFRQEEDRWWAMAYVPHESNEAIRQREAEVSIGPPGVVRRSL